MRTGKTTRRWIEEYLRDMSRRTLSLSLTHARTHYTSVTMHTEQKDATADGGESAGHVQTPAADEVDRSDTGATDVSD